jgi:hypothetical protein
MQGQVKVALENDASKTIKNFKNKTTSSRLEKTTETGGQVKKLFIFVHEYHFFCFSSDTALVEMPSLKPFS